MAYKSSTKQLTTNPKVFITIIKVAKVVQGNLSDNHCNWTDTWPSNDQYFLILVTKY